MWKPGSGLTAEHVAEQISALRADQRFVAKYDAGHDRADDQKLLVAGLLGVNSAVVEQAIAAFESGGPSALELWLSGE